MRVSSAQSLNTLNHIKRTNTDLNKTLQSLASGYQINSASDNAVGLSISEKLKAQVRGLERAASNVVDGISLINTAEGGLGQIQNPNLVKMRELLIQAGNDTLTTSDRQAISQEIDSIKQSIDDIAEGTNFNTIPLLTPDRIDLNSTVKQPIDVIFFIDDSGTMANEIEAVRQGIGTFAANLTQYGDIRLGTVSIASHGSGTDKNIPLTNDVDDFIHNLSIVHTANGGGTLPYEKIMGTINGSSDTIPMRPDSKKVFIILTDTGNENTLTSFSQEDVKNALTSNGIQSYLFGINLMGNNNYYSKKEDFTFVDEVFIPANAGDISSNITPGLADTIIENSGMQELKQTDIILQVGPNAGQEIKIPLYNSRADAIGLGNLTLGSYDEIMESLNRVDIASSIISERRSTYGALTNRLDHANNNIVNTQESLTKSLSLITDADIASASQKLSQQQILLQASQSMLTQINSMANSILKILE